MTMADQADETPVLDLLTQFAADSLKASGLDNPTLMRVRIAALVASDAPPASYVLNLGAASQVGLEVQDVRAILLAIAPIVGTTRVMAVLGNIRRGLRLELELLEAELEELEAEEDDD
jgi:hypothetical protein